MPHRFFPIVAYLPEENEQDKKNYAFMFWKYLSSESEINYLFRLPESAGNFRLSDRKIKLPHPILDTNTNSFIAFKVLNETQKGQFIEAAFHGEDYTFIGRYRVKGNYITPHSFDNGAYTTIGGILGLIVGLLVAKLARKKE